MHSVQRFVAGAATISIILSKVKSYDLGVQVHGGEGKGKGEGGGVYNGLCWLRKENCTGKKNHI